VDNFWKRHNLKQRKRKISNIFQNLSTGQRRAGRLEISAIICYDDPAGLHEKFFHSPVIHSLGGGIFVAFFLRTGNSKRIRKM